MLRAVFLALFALAALVAVASGSGDLMLLSGPTEPPGGGG
jgi:hypothetical protein